MSLRNAILGVALAALGVLVFGGLLAYYGDHDAQEYKWKGPVGAVLIVAVCMSAVASLTFSTLVGWIRAIGYIAVVLLGAALSLQASASYYDVRCDDPEYGGSCGVPELAIMGWAAVAAVAVTSMVLVAETAMRRRSRVAHDRET